MDQPRLSPSYFLIYDAQIIGKAGSRSFSVSPFCQCFVHPVHLARHELPPLLKYNVLIDHKM